jgi:hypothetical protein
MPKITHELSAARIKELARKGAETALQELRADIIAIERTFGGTTFSRDSRQSPRYRCRIRPAPGSRPRPRAWRGSLDAVRRQSVAQT